MTIEQQTSRLRKWVYSFLIVVAVGAAIGRILAVERVYEPSLYKDPTAEKDKRGDWPSERPPALPTFSSNDRSRWATVRCLVEHGTYVIGERDRSLLEPGAISLLAATNGLDAAALAATGYTLRVESTRCTWKESEWESGWDTVDKVLHPGTQKFYSSKPPLLSTLVAGLYWILHKITGWTFALNVWEIVKILLVVINVLPFAVYLFLLSRLVERFGQSDWSRLYIVTAAAFATLVTPFLITFNNHTFGTFSVVFALFPALTILTKTKEEGKPSFCHYLWAGFFASFAACVDLPAAAFAGLLFLLLLFHSPKRTLLFFLPAAILPVAGFLQTNYLAIGGFIPAYAKTDTLWYLFEGSHWAKPEALQSGIDYAFKKESKLTYIFHSLFGHHGLFSLTPMYLLSFLGMILFLVPRKSSDGDPSNFSLAPEKLPYWFFPFSLVISIVVVSFLLYATNNYGGWTCGFRRFMWMTPLWLLCMIPVLDWLGKRAWGRWLSLILLGLSVVSVSFPAWNPWRHPWIYRWLDSYGMIPY